MASRLSEEGLKAVYDTGHQGLAIQPDRSLDLLTSPTVDLERLLLAEDPEAAVQAVPPQPLYNALMQKGPEDCLEVLAHASTEQVVRIFDYDCWAEDRLAPLKAIRWLNLFKEIGPEQLQARFRSLDEEYQLSLLGPLIDVYDEDEFEDLGQEEQDALHRMPCGTLFYKIKSDDTRIEEFVTSLVEATLGQDINYAYSLLNHAAAIPPNEQEDQLGRFRKARLEEDGFISFEESLAIFRPVALAEIRRAFGLPSRPDAGAAALTSSSKNGEEGLFLQRVMQLAESRWSAETFAGVSRGFAMLANSLAAAAKVETDDMHGLRRLLQQGQAMASLGLEYLADRDPEVGADVLSRETPQVLFRTGLTVVLGLAEATLEQLARHRLPSSDAMKRQLKLDKRGVLLHTIEGSLFDLLGFERVETLKGLANRFPVCPVQIAADAEGAKRVVFSPVSSLATLDRLAAAADGICGLLFLASLAGEGLPEGKSVDLDRQLLTALARVLVGGSFRSEPLRQEEVEKLATLPREAMQTLAADFFAGVEGTLRDALASGDDSWAASRTVKTPAVPAVFVADPVQAVMTEFASLVMRLLAVLGGTAAGQERPDASDVALALRSLVVLQDRPQEGVM